MDFINIFKTYRMVNNAKISLRSPSERLVLKTDCDDLSALTPQRHNSDNTDIQRIMLVYLMALDSTLDELVLF